MADSNVTTTADIIKLEVRDMDKIHKVKHEMCTCGIADECKDHISSGNDKVFIDSSCQNNKENCPARIMDIADTMTSEDQCGRLDTANTDTESTDVVLNAADELAVIYKTQNTKRQNKLKTCTYLHSSIRNMKLKALN